METTNEKETQTARKYAKQLGKLFWEKNNVWDYEKEIYVERWDMIMVSSMRQRWSNRYQYQLSPVSNKDERDYWTNCARFETLMKSGHMVPVNPANPNPPVSAPQQYLATPFSNNENSG